MVSTLGTALLCCAALTAAVPSPSLRPNRPPADFDIIVIQIDEPASSESSEREGSGIYDDILNQFFSFQLPEFPGFGRYFFDEDAAGQPSAETEIERPETLKRHPETAKRGPEVDEVRPETLKRQPEIAKRRPEVDDVRPETTMAPVTEVTTHFILTDSAGPATRSGYNFGLSSLLSGMMSSVLSGFVQALKQSPEMVTGPEVVDRRTEMLASSEEDQPEVARLTGSKPQDDLDEDLERKIERLFMENDDKDNDLKHGGAKKIPLLHEHQFFAAEKPRGALFPVIEHRVEKSEAKSNPADENKPKLSKTEETKLSPAQKNEPTWISGKLEFDRKIMELLSAMDDLPEPVSEDASTASPSAKTARSVEMDSEEPVASERVVRENSNASVSPFDDQSTEAVPIFGEPQEAEEAEEASLETPAASSEEQEYFYVPHGESPSPEVFPSTYLFLPRLEETRRSIPDLSAEVVLLPAPRPPRRYTPDFEHYSSLGHEILGYSSLGHGYPGSGYDYPSSAYDYSSLGHDYSSLGHDYSSLGHDYRAVPAFGHGFASMADYARPAVPRFVAARSHPYADLLWPRRKMPMSYHPSMEYLDVAEPRPPMAPQYFLL
nr:PREDICTED: uncharacterized protein LOC109041320 [Bemisia tabaci]